jgi:hypothetical protein
MQTWIRNAVFCQKVNNFLILDIGKCKVRSFILGLLICFLAVVADLDPDPDPILQYGVIRILLYKAH